MGSLADEARVLTSRGEIGQITIDEVMAAAKRRGPEGAGSGTSRLLRFSRPYTPHLILSVLLMACVGAAQGLMALLIKPVFDRVLNPSSAETPVLLFTIPILKHKLFLGDLHASFHSQRFYDGGDRDSRHRVPEGCV